MSTSQKRLLHPAALPVGHQNKLRQERTSRLRKERAYLPTLFDRLRDEAPSQQSEAMEAVIYSRGQILSIIQRDLACLFNTTSLSAGHIDEMQYPQVARSTVNYGVPAIAGGYLSDKSWEQIEQLIRTAITRFEPRIMNDSIIVRPLLQDGAYDRYNVLLFEISGLIHMTPHPIEFMVQSTVDLETNHISIR